MVGARQWTRVLRGEVSMPVGWQAELVFSGAEIGTYWTQF